VKLRKAEVTCAHPCTRPLHSPSQIPADFGRAPDRELTSLVLTVGICLSCEQHGLFTPPAAFEQGRTHLLEMLHFFKQMTLSKCWIWDAGEVSRLKRIAAKKSVSNRKLSQYLSKKKKKEGKWVILTQPRNEGFHLHLRMSYRFLIFLYSVQVNFS